MNVCPECFGNSILQRRIREIRPRFPNQEKCEVHKNRKGVPLAEVGRMVDPALRANYAIGEYMFDHQEGDDLQTIINETTGADDDQVIQALVGWLIENDDYWPPDGGEPFYGDDQSYVRLEPNGWRHSSLWRRFRDDILHRQRFFNTNAEDLLAEIFEGVQYQADIGNQPAFYRLEPDAAPELFRARMVAGDEAYQRIAADPAAEMAPPPPGLRRAGRMNAAGIAVFYAALTDETATAELRPPVGSQICLAIFRLTRPIHVLDLTRFTRPGKQIDIFAKNQLKRTTQWAFMQSFAAEISKPILPGDEHLEYVPAQVVAEYLAHRPMKWRGGEATVNAIMFRSAQNPGGKNIAILGEAARVKPADKPPEQKGAGERPASILGFDFDDLVFPSPGVANAALAYQEGSLRHVEVTSATFAHDDFIAHFPGAPF
jgi:hypothetical protein